MFAIFATHTSRLLFFVVDMMMTDRVLVFWLVRAHDYSSHNSSKRILILTQCFSYRRV